MKRIVCAVFLLAFALASPKVRSESPSEYENRFRIMLDFAVRTNEYVGQHLGDKGLSAYAQAMAEKNATEAERMTPPEKFTLLHPHFLLVVENVERAFFYAAAGNMEKYRHHQKTVRKELSILESLAEKERIEMYLFIRCL